MPTSLWVGAELHKHVPSAALCCADWQSMMAEDPTKRPSAEEIMKVAATFSSKAGLPVQPSGAARRSL